MWLNIVCNPNPHQELPRLFQRKFLLLYLLFTPSFTQPAISRRLHSSEPGPGFILLRGTVACLGVRLWASESVKRVLQDHTYFSRTSLNLEQSSALLDLWDSATSSQYKRKEAKTFLCHRCNKSSQSIHGGNQGLIHLQTDHVPPRRLDMWTTCEWGWIGGHDSKLRPWGCDMQLSGIFGPCSTLWGRYRDECLNVEEAMSTRQPTTAEGFFCHVCFPLVSALSSPIVLVGSYLLSVIRCVAPKRSE